MALRTIERTKAFVCSGGDQTHVGLALIDVHDKRRSSANTEVQCCRGTKLPD